MRERAVAAATALCSSGAKPSLPISTSSAAAVVPPGEVTFSRKLAGLSVERCSSSPDPATSPTIVAFAPNTGTLDINDVEAAAKLVRALKRTHRMVVVSFHGGAEGEEFAHVVPGHAFFDGEDRGDVIVFAHAAIDAGADIVIGQGPHVPRALDIYRGRLIAYSLGNFWTYRAIDTSAARGAGPVLEAWLTPDGSLAGFVIHSTEQRTTGLPRLDPDEQTAGIRARLPIWLAGHPGRSAPVVGGARLC